MRSARLAVRAARLARQALRRGDLEMAVKLVAAAGTQIGLAARPRDGLVFPLSYLRASAAVCFVVEEIAAAAGKRRAVMVSL